MAGLTHSSGFLALVNDARTRVREMTVPEYLERIEKGEPLVLVDVREDNEWDAGRLPGAAHLGKGVLERDIEEHFPDRTTPLVFQCGGGKRSVLVCDVVAKMGYTNTWSLAGGLRGWRDAGLPIERD